MKNHAANLPTRVCWEDGNDFTGQQRVRPRTVARTGEKKSHLLQGGTYGLIASVVGDREWRYAFVEFQGRRRGSLRRSIIYASQYWLGVAAAINYLL